MRNVPICAVYDNLIGYKSLHIIQNEAVAIRGFTNSIIYQLESEEYDEGSPADLSLYCVGYFDMDGGVITPHEPKDLIHGTAIISKWNIDKCSCMGNKEAEKVGEVNDNI